MEAPPTTATRRERAVRRPLRWGTDTSRLVAGAALLLGGALLVVQTTAYTTGLGWLGAAVHVAGWAILPARGGRRVLAAVASMVALVLMLTGPGLAWLASLQLALWLLVRERPPIAYALVPGPALATVIALLVFGPFAPRLPLFGAIFAVAIVCAWIARVIAGREQRPKRTVSKRIDSFSD